MAAPGIPDQLFTKIRQVQATFDAAWTQLAVEAMASKGEAAWRMLLSLPDDEAKQLLDVYISSEAAAAAARAGLSQEAGLAATMTTVCEQLTTLVGQLHEVCHENKSRTRAASEINDLDLQRFRWAARVEFAHTAGTMSYDQLKAKTLDGTGFAWKRGPNSLSEAAHEPQYMPFWIERVEEAAASLQLRLPDRMPASLWRSATGINPLQFRHKDCPFPVSSKNDLICCLGALNNSAVLGVELKKDLDDQALRQAEVEFYTWDSRVTYPFLQVVTDLCRGGVAIWCEGQRPRQQGLGHVNIIRNQMLATMKDVYEFVARAVCHLPDYVLQGEPDPDGNWPGQLQQPDRVKFFRPAMVEVLEGVLEGDEGGSDSEPDAGDGRGPGRGPDASDAGGSGKGRGAAGGADDGRKRAQQRVPHGGVTLGTARSKHLLHYLAALCADADDVANLRDVDEFELSGLSPG